MLSLLCTIGITLAVPAQEAEAGSNDPRMIADYEKAVALIQKTGSFALQVRVDWKTEGDGGGQSGANFYTISMVRPNKFRIEVRPDRAEAQPTLIVVSDGTTVTTLYTAKAVYSQAPFRDPSTALQNNTIVAQSLSGSLIDTLLRPDLVEVVRSHATDGKLVGDETLDGKKLHRYHLRWRRDEEDLWIGPDEEPLLRKMVRTTSVPVRDDKVMKLVSTTTLMWSLNAVPREGTFSVALPENARKVDDIYTFLSEGDAASLLGRPAPALEGLAANRGKKIVVVTFWVSWAAPCRDLLPLLDVFGREHGREGVEILTVNAGETAAQCQAFLKERKLESLPVVLDLDGQALQSFGLSSIPITLLIDKDGIVQAIHRGVEPDLNRTLAAEVKSLLAGTPLVGR